MKMRKDKTNKLPKRTGRNRPRIQESHFVKADDIKIPSLAPIINTMINIRLNKGLTQSDIANMAGIDIRTYGNFERGTLDIKLSYLLKIFNALGYDISSILVSELIHKMLHED